MKPFLRAFIFAYIAVYFTQEIIGGFRFGGFGENGKILLSVAFALLFIFMKPLFHAISLPYKGVGFFILSLIVSSIFLYVLTLFLPNFQIVWAASPKLIILSFMLPSRNLSPIETCVVSAFLIGLIFNTLEILSSKSSKGKGKE